MSGPSDKVTVSTQGVEGMVTVGVQSHRTNKRVEANLTPEDAKELAERLNSAADTYTTGRDRDGGQP